MHLPLRYRTNHLLAALASLTLAAPSFAVQHGIYVENDSVNIQGSGLTENIVASSLTENASGITATADDQHPNAGKVTIQGANGLAGSMTIRAGRDDYYGHSHAYGIRATNGILLSQITEASHLDISGDGKHVYGLYNENNSIDITGDLAGDITINAGRGTTNTFFGSDAYGIYAKHGDVNIGSITNSSRINITAEDYDAAGIRVNDGNLNIANDFAGQIHSSGHSDIYGIFTRGGGVNINNFTESAVISTTATSIVGGIKAYNQHITINNFAGKIESVGTGLVFADGIFALKHVTFDTFAESGKIIVRGDKRRAQGIHSTQGNIEIGTLAGDIDAISHEDQWGHGLYAGRYVNIDNVTDTSQIYVSITGRKTSGINAFYGVNINGTYAGDITVKAMASNNNADIYDTFGIRTRYQKLNMNHVSETSTIRVSSVGTNAAGLFSLESGIHIKGDMAGIIDVSADSYAYGLHAKKDITISHLTELGQIKADAEEYAYGIKSDSGNINFNGEGISGLIKASANKSNAYGIWAGNGVSISNINDTALIDIDNLAGEAYGIKANGSIAITNDLAGDIDIYSSTSPLPLDDVSIGVFAENGDVTINNFSDTGSITTVATKRNIAGIYGDNVSINSLSGDINGRLEYSEDHHEVAAIKADNDIEIGTFGSASQLELLSDAGKVYGVKTESGKIDIGTMAGRINASANNAEVHGLHSGLNMEIDHVLESSLISVTGKSKNVNGMYADSGINILNNYAGDITVNAEHDDFISNAAGMRTRLLNININQIGSTSRINVAGSGKYVYGLYSEWGNVNIANSIAGTIKADAYSDAYGIKAKNNISIGSISFGGWINANADNNAYAIYSENSHVNMNGSIDGIITAKATNGNAYGIYAGGNINLNGIGKTGIITSECRYGSNSYGLYAPNGSIKINGFIAGRIGERYEKLTNHGIWAKNDITIRSVNSTGLISTKSSGIYSSEGSVNITGAFGGDILMVNPNDSAHGIYANHHIIIGSIPATSNINLIVPSGYSSAITNNYRNSGNISIHGELAGDIVVRAERNSISGYSNVNGIRAANDLSIGSIAESSNITVTGDGKYVNGLSAYKGNVTILRELAGDIIISAGEGDTGAQNAGAQSSAIYARKSIHIGSIAESALISASSNTAYTRGIFAPTGDVTIANELAGDIAVSGLKNGINLSSTLGISGASVSIGSITDTGSVTASGTGLNVRAISGGHISILNGMAGRIHAKAQNVAIGIYGGELDLNNITGTISTETDYIGAKAAAITSMNWNMSQNKWTDFNTNNDYVHLNTGAKIVGDIRLGNYATTNAGNMAGQGDVLKLTGSGKFKHNLYGVDTIIVDRSTDNSINNGTWTLNLAYTSDAHDDQRNTFNDILVKQGHLNITGATTNNLTVQENGGLTFNLSRFDTILVNQTASLDGVLDIKATGAFSEGQVFALIFAKNIEGKFDRINAQLTSSLSLAIAYTPRALMGRVALHGDADFSGSVDNTDFDIIANAYLGNLQNATWTNGDFNNDGFVNDNDLRLMTATTNMSFEEIKARIIPEPTTLALFSFIALPLLNRRRKS